MNPAGSAASADVTGTSESNGSAPQTPAQETAAQTERRSTIGRELGLPEEARDAAQPKGSTADGSTSPHRPSEEAAGADAGSESAAQGQAGQESSDQNRGAQASGGQVDAAQVADDVPEPTAQQRSDWPAEALAAVQKARGKAKERREKLAAAERERDELKHKLESTQRPQVTPSQADPLADVHDEKSLGDAYKYYRDLQQFAALNPQGAEDVKVGTDKDGNDILESYTVQQIAKMKFDADRALAEWIPARQQYLQLAQQTEETVRQRTLPAMFEAGTEEHRDYSEVLQIVPEITRFPGYQRTVAHAILGNRLEKLAMQVGQTPAQIIDGLSAEIEKLVKANGKDNGPGKANGQVRPEVAPFLQRPPAIAPGTPGVKPNSDPTGGRTARQPDEEQQAEQIVAEGDIEGAVARKRAAHAKARSRQEALV